MAQVVTRLSGSVEENFCLSWRLVVEREILHFVQNDRFGTALAIFIPKDERSTS